MRGLYQTLSACKAEIRLFRQSPDQHLVEVYPLQTQTDYL